MDKFSLLVIDDQESSRTGLRIELQAAFTISDRVRDSRLASLNLERELVHFHIFETQVEAGQAIKSLKDGVRYTSFLLDADLRFDNSGGTLTGGLSLWKLLIETIGEEHYEEFFATIYTKSGEVRAVLAPILNFPPSRPMFLDFGLTELDIGRLKGHLDTMGAHLDRVAGDYALRGEFKAGTAYPLPFQGHSSVEQNGYKIPVRSIIRDDLRGLIASPVDSSFWSRLGKVLSGEQYYLEISEGDGYFWTRQFSLASLFPLQTKAILDQAQYAASQTDENQIKGALSLIINRLFPSFQAEFYRFCRFFDTEFSKIMHTPKVVYNNKQKTDYTRILTELVSMFGGDSTKKLSHLAYEKALSNLSDQNVKFIKEFLQMSFESILHPDVYGNNYLREMVEGLDTGKDLEKLVLHVRQTLIGFYEKPAHIMSKLLVDEYKMLPSLSHIKCNWEFMDFPIFWYHISQLLRIFTLNFQKFNPDEFKCSGLEKIHVDFTVNKQELVLQISAPGSIDTLEGWESVKRSLKESVTPSCQMEKLSGFRKIACEYYGAEVGIYSGHKSVRATKSQVKTGGGRESGIVYRVTFPKF